MRGTFVYVSGGTGPGRRPATRTEKGVAFIVRWLILSAAVWVAAWIVGGIHLDGWQSTLLVGLILGLLNALLRPLLVLISIPLLILSLGLFLLILNTAILGLAAWIAGKFDSIHFAIDGFWDAFWGALIIAIVGWLLGLIVNPNRVAREMSRR
ncbi:MAG: phage holin family protein [Dehalococcoidia bacterium]|nr:phage holin family protein [Dehalococcoidia bacterium]MCA9825434.1 phage holin family protein [Dehalococcoidia bacterium]MCA9843285.1 phage holin family protein [Dehalococcoidia bacterium]